MYQALLAINLEFIDASELVMPLHDNTPTPA